MSATMSGRPLEPRVSVSTAPLRITILLGGLGVGGAETQAIALAAALQEDGHIVTLAGLADGPLRAVVESHGLALHVLSRVGGLALSAVPGFARHLVAFKPHVVYAFLEVQWVLAIAAASRIPGATRPRVVLGLRTSDYHVRPVQLKARAVRALARHAARRADLLIANSRSGLDSYRAFATESPAGVVVHNGIDVSRFVPSPSTREHWRRTWLIPADATVVGHVGRLHPVKDHELLLHAFARSSTDCRNCHLVCVGHGDRDRIAVLERLANALGIAAHVHFVGALVETHTVFPAFDVLALSSLREGFPNVVAEAMACGVPAVVTNTGASADIVHEFGEVAPVGDTDTFSRALSQLLTRCSPELSHDARRHIASNFSLRSAASRTAAAMQSLYQVNTT